MCIVSIFSFINGIDWYSWYFVRKVHAADTVDACVASKVQQSSLLYFNPNERPPALPVFPRVVVVTIPAL